MINGEGVQDWEPDSGYVYEVNGAMERVKTDLQEGILTKYRVLRSRQLEAAVAENCYNNKNYNMEEAEQCEKFTFKNDYKLNLINSFWDDHAPKHLKAHQSCLTSTGIQGMNSVVEKDKAYADCHQEWLRDFKINQSQALELRAREMLGKSLE